MMRMDASSFRGEHIVMWSLRRYEFMGGPGGPGSPFSFVRISVVNLAE